MGTTGPLQHMYLPIKVNSMNGQNVRLKLSSGKRHVGGAGAIARVGLVALVDCVLVAPPERGPGRFGPFPKWGEPRKFARQVAARSLARTSADVRDARACVYAAVRLGAGQLRVGTRKRSPNGHDRARRCLHARSCRLRNSLARTHICRCASFQDAARARRRADDARRRECLCGWAGVGRGESITSDGCAAC